MLIAEAENYLGFYSPQHCNIKKEIFIAAIDGKIVFKSEEVNTIPLNPG